MYRIRFDSRFLGPRAIFAILLACVFSPTIDYFVVEHHIRRRTLRQEGARD